MAGEIVHTVERQVNDESRSERLCGLEAFFQLGIDRRALNDQVAARYSSPLERGRRTGSVQFSSVSPFTRANSALLFVTSRSPSVRA
jgi:hypothetical protein